MNKIHEQNKSIEHDDMHAVKDNLKLSITLVLILYAIGAFVYHFIEKWNFLDSVYFMTATFTTVGYGDITPKTDIGKIFTIIIAWTGISLGLYLIYSISAYREKRLDKRIKDFAHKRYKGSI